VLIGGVVLAGGGAVLAAAGGSSSPGSAAKTQYCKDGAGLQPGQKCKPKKHKKPRFRVRRNPQRGCANSTFVVNVRVYDKPTARSTFIYRDGHGLGRTTRTRFTLRFDVSRMGRGTHTIKLRVRGSNGGWVTRTVRFRRC
jgi:hypothetical protein